MFPCECLNGAISLRKYFGIPLSHLLNAKSSFISWRRSAFFEVYNWALRYHLSSGISFSAYNDDGVVSIFRHYNNNFHFFLFFCKFHSNFLNINHYQENIGLHMIHSNMYSKRNFRGFTDFLFLCTWSGPKLFDVAGSWRKNIHRYLHIVYYTSTTTCLLLEKCWLRA